MSTSVRQLWQAGNRGLGEVRVNPGDEAELTGATERLSRTSSVQARCCAARQRTGSPAQM